MSTAISGLEANGQALSVIADNVVNANTTGFKGSRAEFHSILAQDVIDAIGLQLGRGVTMSGIATLFTQGPLTRTDRGTDLAINGNGFFVLKDNNNSVVYTRDGSFRFDKEGWLTTLGGSRVQAYGATQEGKITGKLGDVRIPYSTIPAKPTSRIDLQCNLDARTDIGPPLDMEKPDQTSQFTSAIQVFDSIGNPHAVSVYFNKTADSFWEWHAMADGADMAGGKAGSPVEMANGTLTFDQEGKLYSQSQNLVNTSFANGAVPNQKLEFLFGDPIDKVGTGLKGTVQYGSKNNTMRLGQDGWTAGTPVDISIDQEGLVSAFYTNGQNRTLGQLATARFDASERLKKIGENQFRETLQSGQALIGKPNSAGRGVIVNKSLELSNVDLAKEFVDMIKIQRGFQASTKSIVTANDMLEEVLNIKRN
jgi:flagellar hook protein FlgE